MKDKNKNITKVIYVEEIDDTLFFFSEVSEVDETSTERENTKKEEFDYGWSTSPF